MELVFETDAIRWHVLETGAEEAVDPSGGEPRDVAATPLARAARMLSHGGLVVHPTSTVYGLGGRPDPEIDARIATIKGRSARPLIRLAAGTAALRAALPGADWPESADRLASALWPGPLTLVLDDGTDFGVGVRVDAHPVVRSLLDLAGGLMTSTSVNATGRRAARTAREVRAALSSLTWGSGPVGWLDAGDLEGKAPSTIVSLRTPTPEILREGAIGRSVIERTLS